MTENQITQNFLEEEGLNYSKSESMKGKTSYLFSICLSEGMINSIIGINKMDNQCHMIFLFPIPANLNRFPAIAELITRINNDTIFGAFTMDYNDGFVNFQCSFWFESDPACFRKLLNRYFSDSVSTVLHYYPCLKEVAFAQAQPIVSLNQLEYNCDPSLN